MKPIRLIALLSACCSLVTFAVAQAPKHATAPRGRTLHASAPARQMRVTGPVKGAVTGTTFMVAVPRKGPVTVDASKATIRNHGRFAGLTDLRGGAFVQVTGAMAGATLTATEVDILRIPGARRTAKKTGTSGNAITSKPSGKR